MNPTTDDAAKVGQEALEMLRLMLLDDEIAPAARVSAAKVLLDRFSPQDDNETKRREAEERAAALIEARGLLIEITAAKYAGLYGEDALVEAGASEPTDAAAPIS